ncbi:hypothetical protein TOPH_04366 [Tolypocladium ophioglossoides CBS 100239]|uniref:Nucleoside phosphorylase domain-containing protein n=1 Tax=Tolypocladium ophioglossoides (strain CBS 100239) TaxID=1163406 RepID=A0A0L0NA50_TOLOC|nr:hypothetical protein TOPH_04366 [Tolypocladium ophioglossoides CBS 100239]
MASATRPAGRVDFHIAIICALPHEADAVTLLFDQFWDEGGDLYGHADGDTNTYTTGRIGNYDVVLVVLPNMGTSAAAVAAANFRSSYSGLKLTFLVGVCGGVPKIGECDAFLGDVVVSKSIIQYDYGRQYPGGFKVKKTADGRANKDIRSLLASFEMELNRERLQTKAREHLSLVQSAALRKRRQADYRYPGLAEDRLFQPNYAHKHELSCKLCAAESDTFCELAYNASCTDIGCDEAKLVAREHHLEDGQFTPEIFIGCVGSGNTVMKSGEDRDRIAAANGCIAFEMEGAGAWEEVPCIVVKGICDYADSHKNKKWQNFAAATAASVAKAMLERYTLEDGLRAATRNAAHDNDRGTERE